jgi:hypothetical protein
MATEKFANKPITTLNGGISASDLSLVVASASSFPGTPQFRILVENEIMLVTGVSGTTFTIQRGAEGTTAAIHANGVLVVHVLTAAALDLLCQTDDSRLTDDRVASGIRTATSVVSVSSATAPTSGQILVASSSTAAAWADPAAGTTLVTKAIDIDLTTTANTVIDTTPSSPSGSNRWKLMSIDLRLKVALSGGSTPSSVISVGSTSGGQQIVIDQTVVEATTLGTIIGGFSLTSLGTDMSQTNGFEAMYSASQDIYANVTQTGSPTTGTVTAYLLWQGLP